MVKIDSLKHCESFRMIGSWHIIIESEKWLIKLVPVVHRLLHDFLWLTFSYFDGSSLSRLMADLCSNIQCITSCSGKIRFSNGRNDQNVKPKLIMKRISGLTYVNKFMFAEGKKCHLTTFMAFFFSLSQTWSGSNNTCSQETWKSFHA